MVGRSRNEPGSYSCMSSDQFSDIPTWLLILSCMSIIAVICVIAYIRAMRKPGMDAICRSVHDIFYRLFLMTLGRRHADRTLVCEYCGRMYVPGKRYVQSAGQLSQRFCKRCLPLRQEELNQVVRHNNICDKHPFQRVTFRNKCFSCMVEQFVREHPRPRNAGLKALVLRLCYGFSWIPTLRTTEDTWGGSRVAWELLCEQKKVRWCVYVKFYVVTRKKRHGQVAVAIRPLVVGKSGSTLVNASGTDLNFGMCEEYGPARRFLAQNGCGWYLHYVLIKSFRSQQKAYAFENKVMRKFGLFGS